MAAEAAFFPIFAVRRLPLVAVPGIYRDLDAVGIARGVRGGDGLLTAGRRERVGSGGVRGEDGTVCRDGLHTVVIRNGELHRFAVGFAVCQTVDHGRRDVFPLRREGDGGDRVVLGQCAIGALRGHGGFAAAPAGELPVLAGGGDDGGQDGVRPAQTGLGLHRGASVCIKIDTIAALGGPDRVERQRGVIFIDAVEGIDHFAAVHGSPAGLYIADAGEKCAVQREECVLYFQVCDRFAGVVRAWQIGHIVGNGGQLQLFCRIVARNVVLPVGGEICGEIAVVRAAEEDGSVHGRNFFGHNADRCAVRHSADGQSPAGGQIHVVCLAGNGIALHDGRAAEVQLAVVAGIDVDAAAVVAGGVVLNDASGEVADGTRAVDVHAAAVAGGYVAFDLTAV